VNSCPAKALSGKAFALLLKDALAAKGLMCLAGHDIKEKSVNRWGD
jgi:hypothetical protein